MFLSSALARNVLAVICCQRIAIHLSASTGGLVALSSGEDVKSTLQALDVHKSWSRGFRTPENEPFFRLAFDYLAAVFGSPDAEPVLDAGCGSGTKTLELAERGFRVTGVDFSESILETARRSLANTDVAGRISLEQADLTELRFDDGAFSRVLCWGVLMHIPNVGRAVAELARVTRADGIIVVSEGNCRAMEHVFVRWGRRLMGRHRTTVRHTPEGIESWDERSTGTLVTRQANIDWLIRAFAAHGARLERRRAGQLSELFVSLRWRPARLLIHRMNNAWFRWILWSGPACANLLVFRKNS
jgi:ubiquinone/menaquinone biosynthesis C-methylase UbiE